MTRNNTTVIWLKSICGNSSEEYAFWSDRLTIYTADTDLTICFQDTVLAWLPCLGFILTCIPYAEYLRRRKTFNSFREISVLNAIKGLLSVILAIAFLVRLVVLSRKDDASLAEYLAPVISVVAVLISVIVLHWEFRKGIHSSGVMSFFWLFLVVSSVIPLRSYLSQLRSQLVSSKGIEAIVFYIIFGLEVLLLLLNTPSDRKAIGITAQHAPRKSKKKKSGKKNELQLLLDDNESMLPSGDIGPKACPEPTSCFFSRITLLWIIPFLMHGFKNALHEDDIYDIKNEHKTRHLLNEYNGFLRSEARHGPVNDGKLWPVLKWNVLVCFMCRFVDSVLIFVKPIILWLYILYASDGLIPYTWTGISLGLLLMCVVLAGSCFYHTGTQAGTVSGIKLRSTVTALIYRKIMRLSSRDKRISSPSTTMMLLTNDVPSLQDFPEKLINLIDLPFVLGYGVLLLTFLLHWLAALVGVGTLLVISLFLGFIIAPVTKACQSSQLKIRSERLNLLHEIFTGMKDVKILAWEKIFLKKVSRIRRRELRYITAVNVLNSISNVIIHLGPYFATLIAIVFYIFIIGYETLKAQHAFPTFLVFHIIQSRLVKIPHSLASALQGVIVLRKVNKFFDAEELVKDTTERPNMNLNEAVYIENANFHWPESLLTLERISLTVRPGSLICVVGATGSGKSALLSAIAGDIVKSDGKIQRNGSVMHVSSDVWLQQGTIFENIIFDLPTVESKLDKILKSCSMKDDIDRLPLGDQTPCEDQSSPLPDVLKHKINLARALYQDKDIYLLDDPLKVMDPRTRKAVFNKVIGPRGLLRHKTRLFVTGVEAYLAQADYVIVMESGSIMDMGTVVDLITGPTKAATYLKSNIPNPAAISEGSKDLPVDDEDEDSSDSASTSLLHENRKKKEKRPSKLKPIIEVKEDPDGSMSIFDNDEELHQGTLEIVKLIWTYVKAGNIVSFVFLCIFYTIFITIKMCTVLWLAGWTDSADLEGNHAEDDSVATAANSQLSKLIVYSAMGLIQVMLALIVGLIAAYGSVTGSKSMHKQLLNTLVRAPISFFENTPTPAIMSRLSSDISIIDGHLPTYIQYWLLLVTHAVVNLVLMGYIKWWLIFMQLLVLIIYYLLREFFAANIHSLKRLDHTCRVPLHAHIYDTLNGLLTIRSSGRDEEYIETCDRLNDNSHRAHYYLQASFRCLGTLTEIIGALLLILIVTIVTHTLPDITVGQGVVVITYLLLTNFLLSSNIKISTELEGHMAAIDRLKKFLYIPPEAPMESESEWTPPQTWPLHGTIELSNYYCRYLTQQPGILKDINCRIEGGERIGIVGPEGSGKTTFALALLRLLEPARGRILIDNIAVTRLGLHDLRTKITYVTMNPTLFSGTIRENLDPCEEYTDDDVWSALERARLKRFICRSGKGLETCLTDTGGKPDVVFSQMHKQLFCVARGILRNSKIVILDGSAKDIDVLDAVRTNFSKSTIIAMSRRVHGLLESDRILVLDAGRVVEYGHTQVLLGDKNSRLYSMANEAGLNLDGHDADDEH